MKEKKETIIIILLIALILVILGCTYFIYCTYTEEKKKSEEISNNESVKLPVEKDNQSDNDEQAIVVPMELDSKTQKLVDKIAYMTPWDNSISDEWLFSFLISYVADNYETVGYNDGSLYEVEKNVLEEWLQFFSKEKSLDQIFSLQNNSKINVYGCKFQENGDNYIITIPGHGEIISSITLISREVKNNQLVFTYHLSCKSAKENELIKYGKSTITLDYIDNIFSLNNIKFDKLVSSFSCEIS